jgi:glycosyltransferase involved in cell wall biosynthesis
VRVGLIGPLPPSLGGSVAGGVATHLAHLAAGLAARTDTQAYVFGTNVSASTPRAWLPPTAQRGYPLLSHYAPSTMLGFARPAYLARHGPRALARYALAARSQDGSRREWLANVLWYSYFLRAIRPDVVHVQHPLERHLFVRHVRRVERQRWPVVVTAHSFFGEHSPAVIETLMAPNLRSADRVIAVNPHIAEQAVELGAAPDRVRVIRSGVDTRRFQPRDRSPARRRLGVPDDTRLVLFVGNLEPRKQVHVLLDALASLPSGQLAVVGSGESAGVQDQTQRLLRQTRSLGLELRVRFLGRVADVELMDWYAAADVFALPSSSEAQGIVALEAMASGLPVVASAVGGLLGTIDEGSSGFLVPSGDAGALADRLRLLLERPELRAQIGTDARAAVEREFTWQKAVEATSEVYREVAACQAS